VYLQGTGTEDDESKKDQKVHAGEVHISKVRHTSDAHVAEIRLVEAKERRFTTLVIGVASWGDTKKNGGIVIIGGI
jgi:hypothetical protein